MILTSKLPDVGTTIFTVMSQLAAEHNAINLSQGFPNFPIDPKLREQLIEKAQSESHQYFPMGGHPELLDALGKLIQKQYNRTLNPKEQILVTAGATQALFTVIQALCGEGDEVIVLDPSYDSYGPSIRLAGAKDIHVDCIESGLPDWEAIRASCSDQTRMIVTNNPHNPSGRVWSGEDMQELERLLLDYPNLILMSDEVYEFISFEQEFISAHSLNSVLDRIITVSSFGKTFHVTGWKLGYLTASSELMTEIKKVHQFNVFCVNSLAQATITSYLKEVKVNELGAYYRGKRDRFRNFMKDSRFKLLPCDGTYFQLADYSAISDLDDVSFCEDLITKHGVAAIPVSVFNQSGKDDRLIRFCFAKDEETIEKACERLCKI